MVTPKALHERTWIPWPVPKHPVRELFSWTAADTPRPARLAAAIDDDEDALLVMAYDPDTDEAFQCWKVLPEE